MRHRTTAIIAAFLLFFAIADARAQSPAVFAHQPAQVGLAICEMESSAFTTCFRQGNVSFSNTSPHDPWLGYDKFLHAGVSFLLILSNQYVFENKLNMTRTTALPVSMLSTKVIGIGKEVYDWQWGPRRYFSARDLAANTVGIILAVTVIVL